MGNCKPFVKEFHIMTCGLSVVTLAEYYKDKYQITIRDLNQPLLVSNPKKTDLRRGQRDPARLIPELSFLTGLTDEMRANFGLMKDVGNFTRVTPQKRFESMMKFSQRFRSICQANAEFEPWGLKLADVPIQFKGRTLGAEKIVLGGETCDYALHEADWSRGMRNKKFISAPVLNKWLVIYPRNVEGEVREFVSNILRVGPGNGFRIGEPKFFPINDDRPGSFINEIGLRSPMGPDLMMFCMPRQKADVYSAIKKEVCVSKPCASQVVCGKAYRVKGLSVATKVMIQMCAKLGGEPWGVQIPLKDAMVVGFDSWHDSSQKKGVGGFVASLNQNFTSYYSTAVFHTRNEEITTCMEACFVKALRAYQGKNGSVPKKIFFYRDGVGSGDIAYVKNTELKAIQQVVQKIDPAIQVCFTVVSKRINTRILAVNGQYGNPPPSTIVDDVVTVPERYDYFLISQSVRQGTVSPTSYNIIEDATNFKASIHQRLSYKLCHLYYNWQGTVRVPAPCQYAHKIAFIVGESIHREPSEALAERLWYL
ncbi:piwi-like protein Siwi [Artemia franciscana]|uniref:piwi-like protein Siwi n=1 Tax=Artemia franciscana TaxID=6661 RepID=UPI0032DA811B